MKIATILGLILQKINVNISLKVIFFYHNQHIFLLCFKMKYKESHL